MASRRRDTEAWRPPHTIDCRLKMRLAKEFMSNLKLQKQTFACPLQEDTEVGYCYVILHQSVITLSQLSLNNFQPFIPEETQGSASRYPEFPNSLWYILKYAFPLLLMSSSVFAFCESHPNQIQILFPISDSSLKCDKDRRF